MYIKIEEGNMKGTNIKNNDFEAAARYCEIVYGSELLTTGDDEILAFDCPHCGEGIYKAEVQDINNFLSCPYCGEKFEEVIE